MATFDIEPRRGGTRLTLICDDHKVSVSEDFDRRGAEQFVLMF